MTVKMKIILVVITCLLLNSSAVFCAVDLPVDLPAQGIQPAVMQLAALVRLPFTILADITKETPLFPEYKLPVAPKPVPVRETKKQEDSICTGNSFPGMRTDVGEETDGVSLTGIFQSDSNYSIARAAMNSPDTGPLFVIMTLLIYLAILLASNLPWKGVLCPVRKPGRVYARQGFFFFHER